MNYIANARTALNDWAGSVPYIGKTLTRDVTEITPLRQINNSRKYSPGLTAGYLALPLIWGAAAYSIYKNHGLLGTVPLAGLSALASCLAAKEINKMSKIYERKLAEDINETPSNTNMGE